MIPFSKHLSAFHTQAISTIIELFPWGNMKQILIGREKELEVIDDKVFLRLNGMQVFDLNTGAKLWSAAFSGVTFTIFNC